MNFLSQHVIAEHKGWRMTREQYKHCGSWVWPALDFVEGWKEASRRKPTKIRYREGAERHASGVSPDSRAMWTAWRILCRLKGLEAINTEMSFLCFDSSCIQGSGTWCICCRDKIALKVVPASPVLPVLGTARKLHVLASCSHQKLWQSVKTMPV